MIAYAPNGSRALTTRYCFSGDIEKFVLENLAAGMTVERLPQSGCWFQQAKEKR